MSDMLRRTLMIVAGIAIVAAIAVSASVQLITDWWWFGALGYETTFLTQLTWPWVVRILVGLAFATFLYVNLLMTRKAVAQALFRFQEKIPQSFSWRLVNVIFAGASLVLGFLSSATLSIYWETIARFLHRSPFGVQDPLFGRDVGFYIFELPVYRLAYGSLMGILVLTILIVGAIYVVSRAVEYTGTSLHLEPRARGHLLVLLAGALLLKAGDYQLKLFELVYSPRGVIFGAGYTDVNAQALALRVLTVLAVLVAGLLLFNLFRKGIRPAVVALGLMLAASVLLGNVYPGLLQQYVVEPNELSRERPYIEHHIHMTRTAYDLDRIEEREFRVAEDPDPVAILRNRGTLENVRLWDWRPLLQSYRQLQEIRFYYTFPEVDIGRQVINGEYRQVMLAARELDIEQVPNRTWINEHLQYTHGYGVVMNAVNEATAEGLPNFLIRDIPPRTTFPELEVERPEIYFGEQTNHYVLVRTLLEEFDYPLGDTNAWTTYEGTGGVNIGSFFRRAAFALREGTMRIMLSNNITSESVILFHRNIHDRVPRIAPFLRYDQDPYLVLADGRLFWIQDAYTTSNGYPYATRVQGWGNYIRNSVKVVVDAFNGDVDFYIFDEEDPIVQAYAGVYPDLFQSRDAMPEYLRDHVRYPEDLFQLQANLFAIYHMTDPNIFYNQEDVWHIPREIFEGREQNMSPYYTILQLPEEEEPEMVLMLPFTPARRNNMISWVAARMDGDNYGRLLAYRFPSGELVFGPMQIEARIDQDAEISQQLTLWGQGGSDVIRGNLLVLPIQDAIVYVKPLYLQAETGQLPELIRVIVGSGNRIVMTRNLDEALILLFGEEAERERLAELVPEAELDPDLEGPDLPASPDLDLAADPETATLAQEALDRWRQAQEHLQAGDWAGYGRALADLEDILSRLAQTLPEE